MGFIKVVNAKKSPLIIEYPHSGEVTYDLFVGHGVGPLKGNIGSPVLYGHSTQQRHVLAFEIVAHYLEPGREDGKTQRGWLVEDEEQRAATHQHLTKLQNAFSEIYQEFNQLTPNDLIPVSSMRRQYLRTKTTLAFMFS